MYKARKFTGHKNKKIFHKTAKKTHLRNTIHAKRGGIKL
jgi:hypothetical protein